jgi:hypothetical protein
MRIGNKPGGFVYQSTTSHFPGMIDIEDHESELGIVVLDPMIREADVTIVDD